MIAGTLFPIYFIDSPEILNMTVTPIPGSGALPIQVIASSGVRVAYGVSFFDTSGDFIGVYTGDVGSEVLRCIIGGGITSKEPVVIPTYSRVSLRSMTATPITNGLLTLCFLGQGWNGQIT